MKQTVRKTPGALALLLAVIFAAWTAGPAATANSIEGLPDPAGPAVLDPSTAPHGVGVTTSGAEYARGQMLVTFSGENSPRTVGIPPSADPELTADRLDQQPGITDASPNYIAHLSSAWLPNDSGRGHRPRPAGDWIRRQWNFLPCSTFCYPERTESGPRSRGGMNVLGGWRRLRQAGKAGADGVRVAVIDSGIAYRNYRRGFRRNPDLARKRFLPGYDFVRKNRLPLDRYGHGTHVASTIAQTTNNRIGMTGIAYRAKLIPVRSMDSNGFGTSANVVAGIRWAANHRAQVIVMSFNFGCGTKVPALSKALRYAHRKGVVLVASSGNRTAQACPSLPATAPQAISIGGTTESGCVGDYSFRSRAVDLAAPGGGRDFGDCPWSSRDRSIMQMAMPFYRPNRFLITKTWSGTSMAAAHVAGAAAAVIASGVLSKNGPAQVRRRLIATARLPEWAEGDPASGFGAGIVDLGRALNPNLVVPGT